ncbi:cysteine desulfurase family protein [Olsenella massiliensis]|uniref:cysteine desulfurase family protein n=1 Tax=Olsenella massiliensis TaxID=1622075 RepID=UPI00071D055B|nr:cysteine desulfurase family protein [Olsenella massiliensis]
MTTSCQGVPATGAREVYLDYAAATPMDPRVIEAMLPYLGERFWNPSAPYRRARQAKDAVEDARRRLARVIGARPDNLVLTAGATEANNLAFAAVDAQADAMVLVDAIEHESVLSCAAARPHRVMGVGSDGRLDPRALEAALSAEVGLVSVELANGEIGAIQPIRRLSQVVAAERRRRLEVGERRPLWLHVDASQAAGHLSVNVSTLGADLMTLSASKIYGPKQVGLLWASDDVTLSPLILGGGQEGGLRSGTENVAGVVAFAAALELADGLRAQESRRLRDLRNRLQRQILTACPWAWVSGPRKDARRLPGLLHLCFPLLDARRLVILLERRGVSVGTGSACAASKMRVSHVLSAIGVPDEVAAGSLRLTLGRPTTEDEVTYAAEALVAAVHDEMGRLRLSEDDMCAASRELRVAVGGRSPYA